MSWKSPGPEGFHSGLYQKNWELVGADVTKVCLQVLNDHLLKVKVPRKVSEFRQISLCNVIYKTKTLAYRLNASGYCLRKAERFCARSPTILLWPMRRCMRLDAKQEARMV